MTEPGLPSADGRGRCEQPASGSQAVAHGDEAHNPPARDGAARSGGGHGPGGHGHGGHGHGSRLTLTGQHRKSLVIVLFITLAVAVAEAAGAWVSGALVLFADAAHMAADVAGIGLSLLAVVFATRPATPKRTFGYARAEILAAMTNAVVLFAMSAFIIAEAIDRLITPTTVQSPLIVAFGVAALVANGASLWVLRRGQSQSLNIKGAFLEVASDAFGAAAVIVTGIVVAVSGFTRADPIASLLVGALILPRTWRLLADAIDVLLEASPRGIDLSEVRRHLVGVPGVADVHDLHAWTITSGLPVISVHVVVEPQVLADGSSARMLDVLQECLSGHFDVEHSTFQLELAGHADHEQPMHQ